MGRVLGQGFRERSEPIRSSSDSIRRGWSFRVKQIGAFHELSLALHSIILREANMSIVGNRLGREYLGFSGITVLLPILPGHSTTSNDNVAVASRLYSI
jgi:hypothetical protein